VLEQGRMTYLGDIDEALEAYTASEKGAKTPSSK
jgi:hypothetical protein